MILDVFRSSGHEIDRKTDVRGQSVGTTCTKTVATPSSVQTIHELADARGSYEKLTDKYTCARASTEKSTDEFACARASAGKSTDKFARARASTGKSTEKLALAKQLSVEVSKKINKSKISTK